MREIDYAKSYTLKLLEERDIYVVNVYSGEYDNIDCHIIDTLHNTIRYTFYFDVEGTSYWLMVGEDEHSASETENFQFHMIFEYIENQFKINLQN